MATSDRQKDYNRRYREKKAKIKGFESELGRLVAAMEKLPHCPECASESQRIGQSVLCWHTATRARYQTEAEIVRVKLEQLDH